MTAPAERPDLEIRLKRHADGSASLTCTRRDGSVTWQRQARAYAMVFPQHDLTHYVVETTLGFSQGFFGLVADGWEVTDFAKPWPRGPVPAEGLEVEMLVGFFDADRRQGAEWTAAAFAAHAASYVAARAAVKHQDVPMPRTLTQAQIDAIRAQRDALIRQWLSLRGGEELRLPFQRAMVTTPA